MTDADPLRTEPATGPTPHDDGFSMPPEWAPHQLTLMAWPCRTDGYTWPGRGGDLDGFERARAEHAAVANAVAEFEPVLMLVRPEHVRLARSALSTRVELLEAELDDAWLRDNGPIFVTDRTGQLALVHFRFNAWGEKFSSYDRDARVPEVIARHLGVRRYVAPIILEGGAFFVDGEGTLLTTEQCLLHENRNPTLSRSQIEAALRDYVGAECVLWLGEGHHDDFATDGHVDDVAHFLAPGRILLHAPSNLAHPDHVRGRDNLTRLARQQDAQGRRIEVISFDPGGPTGIPYLNLYVCNGGVVAPVDGSAEDEEALAQIRQSYPGREIVTVHAEALFTYGGGGPHCITQQVPAGSFAPQH